MLRKGSQREQEGKEWSGGRRICSKYIIYMYEVVEE